jgi:hypothetical protein
MEVTNAIEKLEKSKEFASWRKDHSKAYLVHVFKMLDPANEKVWQIGYYNPTTNLISVFIVDAKIMKNEDAEVFKEQKKLVAPLQISTVSIDQAEALAKAKEILSENYKGSTLFKSFMILQNIDDIGQVWNITFLTQQFKTINVKVDSKTGECKSHKIVSLLQGEE